jgi:hypothetical protein
MYNNHCHRVTAQLQLTIIIIIITIIMSLLSRGLPVTDLQSSEGKMKALI